MSYSVFRSQGLSVIPLEPFKKYPMKGLNEWEIFCSELPSDEVVAGWDRLSKITEGLGYGLCLGPASGLIAIDIDSEEYIDIVPDSSYVKKGKKGETRFFRYNGEKAQKFHKIGIEVLSLGNQTAIPPSFHPDTKRQYKWIGMYEGFISRMDLEDLPPGFIDKLETLANRAKVEEVESVKAGRHVSLVKVMTSLVAQGKPNEEIRAELLAYDKKNHKPQYFTDPSGQSIEYFMKTMLKSLGGVTLSDPTHIDMTGLLGSDSEKEDETILVQTNDEDDDDLGVPEVERPDDSDIIDFGFPEPRPGLMKDIFDLVMARSIGGQMEAIRPLAIATSLSVMSMICARKLWGAIGTTEKNTIAPITPNLFAFSIAQSGIGKDAPQQVVKDLLLKRGILEISKPKSGTVLLDGLNKTPIRLDMLDEAHQLFESMKANQANTTKEIQDFYLGLYSNADKTFGGTRMMTAGGTNKNIDRPHVSILGSMTPGGFDRSVNSSMLNNGFFARIFFFRCGKPRDITLQDLEVERDENGFEYLESRVASAFSLVARIQHGLSGGNIVSDDVQVKVLMDHDAYRESNLFDVKYRNRANLYDDDSWQSSVFRRIRQNAVKLALLDYYSQVFGCALDGKPFPTRIGIESVTWGQAVTLACIGSVKAHLDGVATAGNDYESVVSAIIYKVKGGGRYGIKKYTLFDDFKSRQLFGQALKQLIGSGILHVKKCKHPSIGRKTCEMILNKAQYRKARKDLVC